MKPTIQAVRGIAAEYLWRMLKPLLIIGVCVLVVLYTAGIWLTIQNAWWWFLLAPIIVASLLFVFLAVMAKLALKIVASEQTRTQKKAVRGFVDQMERVTENVKTPYPVILFRVVRDVMRPKTDGYVATFANDSKTLAPGFISLVKEFDVAA